jgi:uncharacterized membrane protein YidH (DUF202 family)
MYYFIFYFFYISSLWKYGEKGARVAGASMVFFALLFHLFLAFIFFEKLYSFVNDGNTFLRQSDVPQNNLGKWILILFGILILVFGILYFNEKRVLTIKKKYSNISKKDFLTPYNIIKFIVIVFAPIILVLIFG